MADACSEMITVPAGRFRADKLAALVPPSGWQWLSCAGGSNGPRLDDWALISTAAPGHQLLVRRHARRRLPAGTPGDLRNAQYTAL
jgi:hypothetical protein